MERNTIIIIIVILSVFLLFNLYQKDNSSKETFIDTILSTTLQEASTPGSIIKYIDKESNKISTETPCSSMNEYGQCADGDIECEFGGRDTISSQTLEKCHGNLHQTENLECTTRLLYKDDYENIKTSLNEQHKELDFIASDANTNSLANEDHIIAFHDYESKLKNLLTNEIGKRTQRETFVNIEASENIKMLYPSSKTDFIGTYDIQQGQFKLLWNCSIKLQNERMTLYNTHGDIIRSYKVSTNEVKNLQFPTKTIQLTLEDIPLESYKQQLVSSKVNRNIREQLLNAQRQLLIDIIGLHSGKYYLFGNDGIYIMYDYTKNAILYLDRTS